MSVALYLIAGLFVFVSKKKIITAGDFSCYCGLINNLAATIAQNTP